MNGTTDCPSFAPSLLAGSDGHRWDATTLSSSDQQDSLPAIVSSGHRHEGTISPSNTMDEATSLASESFSLACELLKDEAMIDGDSTPWPGSDISGTSGSCGKIQPSLISSSSISLFGNCDLEPWPMDSLTTKVDGTESLISILSRRLLEGDCYDLTIDTFRDKHCAPTIQAKKKRSPRKDRKKDTTSSRSRASESTWLAKYQELLLFYQVHGHCNVPAKYAPNPSLAHWVKRQRAHFKAKHWLNADKNEKSSSLDEYRENLLNRIDFVWDVQDANWTAKFQKLCAFQKEYQHTNVPISLDADPTHPYAGLGVWVKCQRRQYRLLMADNGSFHRSNLTPARVQRLNEIAFDWTPRDANFGICLVAQGNAFSLEKA